VEEKEENFVLHVLEGGLVIMERHYSRRNRSAAGADVICSVVDLD
jgi:hypothetical protein